MMSLALDEEPVGGRGASDSTTKSREEKAEEQNQSRIIELDGRRWFHGGDRKALHL